MAVVTVCFRMKVRVGQAWMLLVTRHDRVASKVRIVRILSGQAHYVGIRNRALSGSVRVRTLERGRRGARLVSAPDKRSTQALVGSIRMGAMEQRSASEVRKIQAPRGLMRCSEEDRTAAEMAERGVTHAEIAKALGCSPNTVRTKLLRFRQSEYDARQLKALGG